jgi:hypothetical protein
LILTKTISAMNAKTAASNIPFLLFILSPEPVDTLRRPLLFHRAAALPAGKRPGPSLFPSRTLSRRFFSAIMENRPAVKEKQ